MKKGFTFAVILLLLNINVRAQQISPDEAKETALQFMQSHDEASRALPRGAETVSLSYTAQTGQNNDFYVFNYPNDGGFVIVSADTRTLNPVLAYSTQGSFNADYIPENEAYLLSTYQQQIESLRQNEIVNTIVYGNSQEPNVIVEPLIKTQWKQSEPYNGMCPIDSVSRKQCLVGCIATAMAQVMNYWKWPEKGHGLHYNYNDTSLCVNFDESVYDWDNTLSIYDSESESGIVIAADDHAVGLSGFSVYVPDIDRSSIVFYSVECMQHVFVLCPVDFNIPLEAVGQPALSKLIPVYAVLKFVRVICCEYVVETAVKQLTDLCIYIFIEFIVEPFQEKLLILLHRCPDMVVCQKDDLQGHRHFYIVRFRVLIFLNVY